MQYVYDLLMIDLLLLFSGRRVRNLEANGIAVLGDFNHGKLIL